MSIINNFLYRVIFLLISIILLSFFSYYSKDFKLDASSDTLIYKMMKISNILIIITIFFLAKIFWY